MLGVFTSTLSFWLHLQIFFVFTVNAGYRWGIHLLTILLNFSQEGLAAAFGNGLSTGCVVNIGAQVTSVICIEVGSSYLLPVLFTTIFCHDSTLISLWLMTYYRSNFFSSFSSLLHITLLLKTFDIVVGWSRFAEYKRYIALWWRGTYMHKLIFVWCWFLKVWECTGSS